jgi:hypothetical protein
MPLYLLKNDSMSQSNSQHFQPLQGRTVIFDPRFFTRTLQASRFTPLISIASLPQTP